MTKSNDQTLGPDDILETGSLRRSQGTPCPPDTAEDEEKKSCLSRAWAFVKSLMSFLGLIMTMGLSALDIYSDWQTGMFYITSGE